MDIPAIMHGPRLKVQRAYRHIDELAGRSEPLDRSLYEIVVDQRYSIIGKAKPDIFEATFIPKEPIPETFALIIGDAIHCLRSALDHVATETVRQARISDAFVNFPFAEERKDLESRTGFKRIQEAIPSGDVLSLFRSQICPYRDGNFDLWAITKLDNIDKHNFILPTVSVADIDDINMRVGPHVMKDCGVGGDASEPIKLFRTEGYPVTIQNDFKTRVEIRFPEGFDFFGGEEVVPTLRKLSQITSETLNSFERFLCTHAA